MNKIAFSILLSGSLRILYIKYIYLMISSTPIIIVYTKNIHADDIIIYAVFLCDLYTVNITISDLRNVTSTQMIRD